MNIRGLLCALPVLATLTASQKAHAGEDQFSSRWNNLASAYESDNSTAAESAIKALAIAQVAAIGISTIIAGHALGSKGNKNKGTS